VGREGVADPAADPKEGEVTTSDVLRAARARIDSPEKWCQHVCGRDAEGWEISPSAFNADEVEHAVSCCAVASLLAVAPQESARPALYALAQAVGMDDKLDLISWNNAAERTHADVMAAFDRAIAAEEVTTDA
jgi:hypothetical protein